MKTMTISISRFNEFMRLQDLEGQLVSRLTFYLDQQKLMLKRMEEINNVANKLKDLKQGNEKWFKKAHPIVKEAVKNRWSCARFTDKSLDKLQEIMGMEND